MTSSHVSRRLRPVSPTRLVGHGRAPDVRVLDEPVLDAPVLDELGANVSGADVLGTEVLGTEVLGTEVLGTEVRDSDLFDSDEFDGAAQGVQFGFESASLSMSISDPIAALRRAGLSGGSVASHINASGQESVATGGMPDAREAADSDSTGVAETLPCESDSSETGERLFTYEVAPKPARAVSSLKSALGATREVVTGSYSAADSVPRLTPHPDLHAEHTVPNAPRDFDLGESYETEQFAQERQRVLPPRFRWQPTVLAVVVLAVVAAIVAVLWQVKSQSGGAVAQPLATLQPASAAAQAAAQAATTRANLASPQASNSPSRKSEAAKSGAGSSTHGSPAATASGGDTVSPTPAQFEIYVHVTGAVAKPGIVKLIASARVFDALNAAGGATTDAQQDSLNLAAPVKDGQQIHVPRVGEQVPASADAVRNANPAAGAAPANSSNATGTTTGATAGSTTGTASSTTSGTVSSPGSGTDSASDSSSAAGTGVAPINLNSATAADLDVLPGIGPALAQRIIDWRAANGNFATVDELDEVSGIGPKLLEKIRPLVAVS